MMQGQVFLKKGGWDFSVQGLSFLHLEITLLSAKLCYAFFFCHDNFMKKIHFKLSKNKPGDNPEMKIT